MCTVVVALNVSFAETRALRQEVSALKSDRASKEVERIGAEKELNIDYGPEGAFYKLKGACYDAFVQK